MRVAFQYLPFSFFFIAGLMGCVQNGLTSPYQSLTEGMPERWHIHLKLSGGFSGISRAIELSNAGEMIIIEKESKRRVISRIPEKALADIALLIENVEPLQPSGRFTNCKDCLQYDIIISMNDERLSIQLNDLSMPGSGIEPLINILLNLQERALAGDAKN